MVGGVGEAKSCNRLKHIGVGVGVGDGIDVGELAMLAGVAFSRGWCSSARDSVPFFTPLGGAWVHLDGMEAHQTAEVHSAANSIAPNNSQGTSNNGPCFVLLSHPTQRLDLAPEHVRIRGPETETTVRNDDPNSVFQAMRSGEARRGEARRGEGRVPKSQQGKCRPLDLPICPSTRLPVCSSSSLQNEGSIQPPVVNENRPASEMAGGQNWGRTGTALGAIARRSPPSAAAVP
ncbi:hypothetical protein BGZ61DRAFT_557431 [Ilyonectria robusta]|uniref:uncharacterized protein n=1 Tax=Ilyonectria robusta TaxID=1079257 RepID=UPI001E8CA78F|nr:uncharacterized protein BGZ61DRAFT_557431 [Ilyonectria robusta]KAH8670082.1 hypothetical protein BGZ61DRAFT_557431 [Ilyonectria robusta]